MQLICCSQSSDIAISHTKWTPPSRTHLALTGLYLASFWTIGETHVGIQYAVQCFEVLVTIQVATNLDSIQEKPAIVIISFACFAMLSFVVWAWFSEILPFLERVASLFFPCIGVIF